MQALFEAVRTDKNETAAEVLAGMRPRPKNLIADAVKLLKEGDPQGRRQAAIVLATIGPDAREAIPALSKALKDKEPTVRQAVKDALEKIRRADDP